MGLGVWGFAGLQCYSRQKPKRHKAVGLYMSPKGTHLCSFNEKNTLDHCDFGFIFIYFRVYLLFIFPFRPRVFFFVRENHKFNLWILGTFLFLALFFRNFSIFGIFANSG